jgi:hypothetical protein
LIKLGAVQLGIQPALAHQLLVPAALHNPALIDHDDQIGIADRRQPMRDDDAGPPLHRQI